MQMLASAELPTTPFACACVCVCVFVYVNAFEEADEIALNVTRMTHVSNEQGMSWATQQGCWTDSYARHDSFICETCPVHM